MASFRGGEIGEPLEFPALSRYEMCGIQEKLGGEDSLPSTDVLRGI